MTVEKAIEVIDDFSKKLGGPPPEEYSIDWAENVLQPFDANLLETEPFSPLKFGWLFTPDGGGSVFFHGAAPWVLERLRDGLNASVIVESIRAELSENVGRVAEITAITGADVDEAIILNDNASIIPAKSLDKKWRDAGVQKSLQQGKFEFGDCCVLVQKITVTPGMIERKSREEPVDEEAKTAPSATRREEVRQIVRAAFLLAGTTAVEMPARTLLPQDRNILAVNGYRFGTVAQGLMPFTATGFKSSAVKTYFEALSKFPQRESLVRAVDRLGRARSGIMPADKALDLGIAAEILLMHDADNSNTEITHKLGIRSAWLLGKNAEDRIAVAKGAKAIYRARSTVAHSGQLPEKIKFDPPAADEFVSSVAKAVLDHGRFPDWERMCAGG